MTEEQLKQAHELSAFHDDDATAKQPTRQLVRKMLTHIDALAIRNQTLERKCNGLELAGETLVKELHAAIDRAEKADLELCRIDPEEITEQRDSALAKISELQTIINRLVECLKDAVRIQGFTNKNLIDSREVLSAAAPSGAKEKQ